MVSKNSYHKARNFEGVVARCLDTIHHIVMAIMILDKRRKRKWSQMSSFYIEIFTVHLSNIDRT